MTAICRKVSQQGFTLLEMLVSLAVFILISSAIFGLIDLAQKRNFTEMELLASFQDARFGMDQIIRDVNDSGYPPQNQFSVAIAANSTAYANSPVAWSPAAYPTTPCLIGTAGGGTCTTPGDFDVILEEAVDNTGTMKWIRYQLQGTTLFRGMVNKATGVDPAVATSGAGVLLPYVLNVVNNASATQIGQFKAAYPSMFPGGNPQPIFQFYCDTPAGPVLCQNAAGNNSPANIRDVEVTLIVKTAVNDAQTNRPRLMELNGRGHRLNPNH